MTTASDDSITDETFKRAAKGAGVSIEEAKRNTLELLRAQLEANTRTADARKG